LYPFHQDIENPVEDFPQVYCAGTTSRFSLWNQVTQQFILLTGEVTGVSFTHNGYLGVV
jgi:hypothetical protein